MVLVGVKLGYPTLIAGHVLLALPCATLILGSAVGGLDPAVEEAAADLGCGPRGVFLRVTLPLLLPGIVASGLLCFTISFDDIAMSIFASGVGTTTLPLRIYSMLKTGVTPEINALGTVLVALNIVAIAMIGVRQLRGVVGGAAVRREGGMPQGK
jgi:ABC-type spermidine/putrescine transport system permease subunit II